jgi:CRISPR-associated protein Cas5d
MFHGFDYPDEKEKDKFSARFWHPKMVNGEVNFIRPEVCTIRKYMRPMKAQPPESVGLDEDSLRDMLAEGGFIK